MPCLFRLLPALLGSNLSAFYHLVARLTSRWRIETMPTRNLRIILLLIVTSCLLAATAKHPRLILPFSLSDVDLLDEDFKQGAALNHEYLLMLEVDNLLFNFR